MNSRLVSYAIGGDSYVKRNQQVQDVQQLVRHVDLADSLASAAAASARIPADSVAAVRQDDLNGRYQGETF